MAAAARAPAGRREGVRSSLRRAPSHAPTQAAARAIARPASTPSGASAAGHGRGIQTWVQAHSEARPTVPIPVPAASASGSGRRRAAPPPRRRAPRPGRAGSAGSARPAAGRRPAPSARASPGRRAPRPARRRGRATSRAATSATPAASMISIGWKIIRNCGTPKSNSAWNVESPSSSAPGSETRRMKRDPRQLAAAAGLAFAPAASTNSTARPTRVIAAPPISIRCVGPHSVTSWPNRRCQTSSSGKPISENAPRGRDQHAAERRVPAVGELDRRRATASPAAGRSRGTRSRTRRTARRG